jgi:hypothetical protein
MSRFLHADYDLVHVAKTLLALIPATIVAEWVKGHFTGEHREYKHDLNEKADRLATSFNMQTPPAYKQCKMSTPPPNYAIHLLHNSSNITNKL